MIKPSYASLAGDEGWLILENKTMDRFECRCRLDWWMNSVTLLASVEVEVVVTATDTGWNADGRLIGDNNEEREWFAFLCQTDSVFALRLEDESTIAVTVYSGCEDGRFVLTEYVDPGGSGCQPSRQPAAQASRRVTQGPY